MQEIHAQKCTASAFPKHLIAINMYEALSKEILKMPFSSCSLLRNEDLQGKLGVWIVH